MAAFHNLGTPVLQDLGKECMSDSKNIPQYTSDLLAGQMIYVSDTHIRTMSDNRGQLLLDLINRIDSKNTKYFVLNGDIFDFCFGATAYFRQKFAPLGDALTKLGSQGVEVIYVEGNHEFQLDQIGWKNVRIVKDEDLVLDVGKGVTIKVAHGDLIMKDRLYFAYRGLVKSQFFSFLAQLFPSRWVDAFSLKYASESRKRDEYRHLNHEPLLSAANKWVGTHTHGVFGHFHTPYAEQKAGNSGLLVCVDSWFSPNALVFDDGEFRRVSFAKVGEKFAFSPLKSLLG